MYFSEFPQIFYSFPTSDGKTYSQILTDITLNVRFKTPALEKIALWDEYNIKDGETPEIISEKFYNNPEYHWTIMLANQRYDIYRDFPLNSNELYNYVVSKYTESGVYEIHHYEIDNIQRSPYMSIFIPYQLNLNSFNPYDVLIQKTESGMVKGIGTIFIREINNLTIVATQGTFKENMGCELYGTRNNSYGKILDFVIPPNGVIISDEYTPISNYDYEERINENKRKIKIISPKIIEKVVEEFKSIMG